ncbi:DUF3037 domain-containing protein [Loktanella sp. SALINAS62]|nr:DUF3037 domain-containing protein [Loktanella sp. SALINAS62]
MTKMSSFSYCLLQYEHNPWIKERLNVGVLLHCPNQNFLRIRTKGWEGRIFGAYPNLERPHFTEDLKQIERSIERFSKSGLKQPSLFTTASEAALESQNTNKSMALALTLCPDSDSSYRWHEGGVGLCGEPQSKLEDLFHRLVSGYDKQKSPANRSDDQVWSSISKAIEDRHLSKHIEVDPVVNTDLGSIRFHAGYQNGSRHVIQSLSFDLADEDRIGSKAARWAGYLDSIRISDGRVHPHLVLGMPRNRELIRSFEGAYRYLSKSVGTENVLVEDKAYELLNDMEVQLSGH